MKQRLWYRHLQLALCLLLAALWTGPALSAVQDMPVPTTVQIQDGDMASVLAFRLKPRGATIEQMMVALLRHNPDAFIQGNVNLLRDGAVLHLPAAEEVFRTPPEEARDTVQRHHKHFLTGLEQSLSLDPAEATPGAAASTPQPDQVAEKEALLERLRTAKARLTELQQSIDELERLTQLASDPQPPSVASQPAHASTGIPDSWIWLGVAAIVAVMVGVGSARRPGRQKANTVMAATDAATEFQARLGTLDLNLDEPASPPSLPRRTR